MIRTLLETLAKLPASGVNPLSAPKPRAHSYLRGLRSSVDVYLDEAGMAHVFARNEPDAYFAQGYLTARDRLFQMDFVRRAAAGRLAEVLGAKKLPWRRISTLMRGTTVVDADWLMRMFGLRKAALASMGRLSARTAESLNAYCEGVNACIAREPLPPEFAVLRYEPEPWTPADSLSILKAWAWELNVSWRAILYNDALARRFPGESELVQRLLPSYPRDGMTVTKAYIADEQLQSWVQPEDERALVTLLGDSAVRTFLGFSGAHLGSNAWAVSGSKTATGLPFVCNDLHLQLTAPSPMHLSHIAGGMLDVAGATLPGVPGVMTGYNRNIAWGISAGMAHDTDCFIERINPENENEVFFRDEWTQLTRRRETIRVRGEKEPVVREVRESSHGFLISDLLGDLAANDEALAIQWVAREPSGELEAIAQLNRAKSFGEFREALTHHAAPALGVVYADRENHIGYQFAGKIPHRVGGKNVVPVPGWDGEFDWRGYVPFAELPHLFDPAEGMIASANSRVADERYPHYISEFFDPPFRHRRIVELLSAERKYTLRDMRLIQNDTWSGFARQFIERIVKPWSERAPIIDVELEETLRKLLAWDGEAGAESAGAAIFYTFYRELTRNTLREWFGDELFVMFFEPSHQSCVAFEYLLSNAGAGNLPAPRDELIARSLRAASRELVDSLGGDPTGWQWGRLHRLTMHHRLGEMPVVGASLNIGPFATGGDATTIASGMFPVAGRPDHWSGAAVRIICDLANPNNNEMVLSSGQSGHPFSGHYADHVGRWLKGEGYRIDFDRGALERRSALVTLEPA